MSGGRRYIPVAVIDSRPVGAGLGDEATLLRSLLEGTASATGESFFRVLVEQLGRVLGVAGAWVTELDAASRRMTSRAFWLNGRFVDEYVYLLEGTPCAPVIDGACLVLIPERVVARRDGDGQGAGRPRLPRGEPAPTGRS
jgi:hypothetical protein